MGRNKGVARRGRNRLRERQRRKPTGKGNREKIMQQEIEGK